MADNSDSKQKSKLASKKVWTKRNENIFERSSLLVLYAKHYKNLSKNVRHQKMYLHFVGQCSWWSNYVPSTNKLVSINNQKDCLCGNQMQFSPEKNLVEKRKWIHHYWQIIPVEGLCYKKGYIIISSIPQEMFLRVSKCLSCSREKQSWDEIKRVCTYLL